EGTVQSTGSQVVVLPLGATRAISLGGATETTTLTLSSDELDRLSGAAVVVGAVGRTGGIVIEGPVAPAGTSDLRLVTDGTITQLAPITETVFSATGAAGVHLTHAGNAFSQIDALQSMGAAVNLRNSGLTTVAGPVSAGTGEVDIV